VTISLRLLDLPFEHKSISVFRALIQFQTIIPVVKVLSLFCEDGGVLMDATSIFDYPEIFASPN
jgi:hypothetical protein